MSDQTLLTVGKTYSREQVAGIFAPEYNFIPSRGTWGMHGIVPIPERPFHFVFFVTLGQQQGDHVFDEGVTEDGVLTWQSQPRQSLQDKQIQQFIDHDASRYSIYLFLRTDKRLQYTYMGRLAYITHDAERERPVHFQWQIIDELVPPEVAQEIGLVLQKGDKATRAVPALPANTLLQTQKPSPAPDEPRKTSAFKARKAPDYALQDVKNRELGLAGEKLVLAHEKQLLIDAGRPDLAEKVHHISVIEGDGAGYDIRSYTAGGDVKHIEVKTTKGAAATSFFLSENELILSMSNPSYYLYRVYDYDPDANSARFFIVDRLFENLDFTVTQYRAKLRSQPLGESGNLS